MTFLYEYQQNSLFKNMLKHLSRTFQLLSSKLSNKKEHPNKKYLKENYKYFNPKENISPLPIKIKECIRDRR